MKNLKVRDKVVIGLVSTGVAALTLVTSASFYCSTVDHDNDYCYLSNILGLQHQADKINEGVNGFRYDAVYVPGDGSKADLSNHAGDHVTEVVHSTWDSANGFIDVDSIGTQYYVDKGYLKEYEATGERVELYDTNALSGKQLIRVFTK